MGAWSGGDVVAGFDQVDAWVSAAWVVSVEQVAAER
jgi:hypothetical protein